MSVTTSPSSFDDNSSHIRRSKVENKNAIVKRVESWTAKEEFYPVPNFSIKLSHYTILILYSYVVTVCSTWFNIQKFYILPAECIYIASVS